MHSADGQPVIHEEERDGYRIRRYRPRIEGLFSRIERWTRLDPLEPPDVHWRSISKDNILTIYGRDADSRIQHPKDPARVFAWLIAETRDDKGNAVVYHYASENSQEIGPGQAHERNRCADSGLSRTTNRYLKRILYGNRASLIDTDGHRPLSLTDDQRQRDPEKWMFEVVLDYGEHDTDAPTPTADADWPCRPDPFSSYRAGFEVRTYRLCQRVLMFHHFPDEQDVDKDCLVRSTDFTYAYKQDPANARNPVYSFLQSVTQTGYRQRPDGSRVTRSLPPLEFEYSQPIVQDKVETIDPASLEHLPIGVDGNLYQWTDLHGEGIPGILTEQSGAWHYRRNLSPIANGRVGLGPVETVPIKPNLALAGGQARFMDLAGDGQPDLVVLDGPMPGLYEHDDAEGWQPFRPFTNRLNLDTRDPKLRFIDLDGDGHADILISEDDAFVWHASLAEAGFGPARRVRQALDEEKGPRLIFADASQSVYLADLSGDGLTDLARIRNGEVCYWPNLGHGRFGAKVTMDQAPWFDQPDQFDQRRIRLADIDGSGTTDILYLHRDGVRLYFNQSGNAWSQPQPLMASPRVDNLVNIAVADLLGNGTACLTWSSPLPADSGRQMRYVDLMGGQKPHLLIKASNNLGAETCVRYAPSTKFYLQDRRDGRPWITRLPFPVHVVEQVETLDHISHNRFVSRYAYHHGYFDGEEREFRGFGMVEQWDTEEIGALAGGVPADCTATPAEASNLDAASYVPPVHIKTWFHTGAYLDREHISRQHARDYHGAPTPDAAQYQANLDTFIADALLPDTLLPNGLSGDEERQACRALKGSMLRQEVYGKDGTAKAPHPYSVTEQNFSVRRLQPTGENQYAVFFTHPREAISSHSERNPDDPRITQALTLEVDDYGNVLKEAAIGCGRAEKIRVINDDGTSSLADNPAKSDLDDPNPAKSGLRQDDWDRQCLIHITYTENQVTNAVGEPAVAGVIQPPPDDPGAYRTPLPCQTRTYELRKAEQDRSPPNDAIRRFSLDEIADRIAEAADGAHDIAYADLDFQAAKDAIEAGEANPDQSWRRLIESVRIHYRPDDLGSGVNEPSTPDDDPTALLPLGRLESLALPGETYKLAFTPGLLDAVYQRRLEGADEDEPLVPNPAAVLPLPADPTSAEPADRGGYLDLDGDGCWWLPSGRIFYSPDGTDTAVAELAYARAHVFLPHRFRDPFHTPAWSTEQVVGYDSNDLLVTETRDPLGNHFRAAHDYRVLQPRLVTDPNGNRSQVAFDTLGLVVGTAVMGKAAPAPVEGDSLEGFEPDLDETDIAAHLANPLDNPTAILGQASTRLVYDLFAYQRTKDQPQPAPPVVYSLARETHVADLGPNEQPRIQHAFSYSDGFGREIQKKAQAEPGPVPQRHADGQVLHDACGRVVMTDEDIAPRWVASGWTIFNNKGKPVRQYEAFFSPTHGFELGVRAGVSPILFYDPLGRVVATLHPNHCWEKVVFDAWRQDTWDVSDTVGINPRTDVDVKGFFIQPDDTPRLAEQDYLPLWYDLRTDPAHAARLSDCYPDDALRNAEVKAGHHAAAHADTPGTAHLDALGRPFLTIARNRVHCPDHPLDGTEAAFATRVELDIEGNQRAVVDAKDRGVMRYAYDLLGNRIHQASMEAGFRWMLNDIAGNPIRAWDSRGFNRRLEYDQLRRPTGLFVSSPAFIESHGREEIQAEQTVYGETLPNPEQTDHRGQVYQVLDDAGVITSLSYDFKGNLLEGRRQLRREYKKTSDWQDQEPLEDECFDSHTWYDALSRPIQSVAPHSDQEGTLCNVTRHGFNEAGLLERIDVWNQRATEPDGLLSPDTADPRTVTDIDYDAKGQRTRIAYGNGAVTTYSYDPLTFRLTNLRTTRSPGQNGLANALFCNPSRVQDLRYTYDPAGNITRIAEAALRTVQYANQPVEPVSIYTYDAVDRLIQASGREHIGQSTFQHDCPNGNCRDYPFAGIGTSPNDVQALRNYTERYVYDAVGNFDQFIHHANNGSWRRSYVYDEESLVKEEGAPAISNRLSGTILHPNSSQPITESYQHDAHGNMTRMPHLPVMRWDFKDQLSASSRQVVSNGGTPEITYYVYDAAGARMRKVTERQANGEGMATRMKERIYLGGFETYREYEGDGVNSNKERESLHVMDGKQRLSLVETTTFGAESANELGVPVIRYQLGDHLGSASLELDQDGALMSYEEYHPYGTTAFQAVRSLAEVSLKRYRYTGKERDEETGLNYHWARYYSAWLSRWASCDTLLANKEGNLYSYVMNPLTQTDPNGTQPELTDEEFTALIADPLYVGMSVEEYEVQAAGDKEASDKAQVKIQSQESLDGDHEEAMPHKTSDPDSTALGVNESSYPPDQNSRKSQRSYLHSFVDSWADRFLVRPVESIVAVPPRRSVQLGFEFNACCLVCGSVNPNAALLYNIESTPPIESALNLATSSSVSPDISVSYLATIELANPESVDELTGFEGYAGLGAGEGVVVNLDAGRGIDFQTLRPTYHTRKFSFGTGFGVAPVEPHAGITSAFNVFSSTWLHPFLFPKNKSTTDE
ncbi:MAG: toxin [Thiohalocapsa sp.]|nr:toxin [Thiohalocapsa sp.]